jgi:hypothetical protein
LRVGLPRPRDRTHATFVRTVEHILERVLNTGAYPKQTDDEAKRFPALHAEW